MSGVADYLNGLSQLDRRAVLHRCCASERWAAKLARRTPFEDDEAVRVAAREIWWGLGHDDWLEAFSAHPRIGARQLEDRWSRAEQSGVDGAPAGVLESLARANLAYEDRFGFTFLICATGLGAAEMLESLERRLENTREEELRTAAAEQAEITRLRLDRLAEGE